MKIIFAGTPSFAATALDALVKNGHQIVAVLTQPDRPSGRGMQLQPSPVKRQALQHGLEVIQPETLKTQFIQDQLAAMKADVMIVAAYGLILPPAVLNMPRYGCLNIHASLLPRWRGAAPVQRAILAGDEKTGITIMQMDVGLDTGNMILKKSCDIEAHDTAESLLEKLTLLGADAIVEVASMLEAGPVSAEIQDESQVTYASKLTKAEGNLDWSLPCEILERAIRAYVPFPTAYTNLNQTIVKIHKASILPEKHGVPGTILEITKQGIVVACGQGALNLEVLQRPNNRALPAAQFTQGFPLKPGDRCLKN